MNQVVTSTQSSDEISLPELLADLWRLKFWFVGLGIVFSGLAIFYSLQLPNQYKSETVLYPVQQQGGAGLAASLGGQLGGLASMAGLNLGSKENKTALALQILNSRIFFEKLCQKYEMLVPLMAAEGWDRDSNTLLINPDLYDSSGNKWVRQVAAPLTAEPSMEEAFVRFKEILTVDQDKATSMVRIGIEFVSPELAQQWVKAIVTELNADMRQRELSEAERAIHYLNQQLEKTSLQEVRSVMYDLIEEQTKTLMLANVREEYMFQVVDPAPYPQLKSGPKRAFIVIFAGLGSVVMIVLFSIFRLVMRKS